MPPSASPARLPPPGLSARWVLGLLALAGLTVGGCTLPLLRRALREPPPTATARRVSFHGWRHCYRLDNGIVRVTNVPQVGGRTLEYALGSSNFLFLGRRELGTTLPADDRVYRYFGGHFAQLHPQEKWQRLQSTAPPDLYMGRYAAQIVAAQGATAAIEMTAPADLATGTRLVRRVELFSGSTRLRLTDTLTNVRSIPQEWGIQDIVQLKGAPTPSGILGGNERAAGQLVLYVPCDPESRYPGGMRHLVPLGARAMEAQDQWSARPGLLVLRYRRRLGEALVDPHLPWVALADESTGTVFVQKCEVPAKAVLTAGPPLTDYPFIELQSFAPVAKLEPHGSTTLVQEWYAASSPGPVLYVTAAGVVSSPLTLLRGEGKTWAAGRFGVFYVGSAAVVFRRADGGELARLDCGPVHPLRPLALNQAAAIPPGTAEVILEIRDAAGQPVGHLGRILLGAK